MGEQDSTPIGGARSTPVIDDDVVLDLTSGLGSQATIDLTSPAAAQRYSDWAERMRAKRIRNQAHIRGAEQSGPTGPTHWNTDTVIGGWSSDDTGPAPMVPGASDASRWLGVLGLDPRATGEDVAAAYRGLAKLHHPDRWAEADPAVQQFHTEQMLRVNAAYHALRPALPT